MSRVVDGLLPVCKTSSLPAARNYPGTQPSPRVLFPSHHATTHIQYTAAPGRRITGIHMQNMAMATTPLPSTMDAIRVSRPGGPKVLEFVINQPVPTLEEGQVLVRNEYVGVNFIDTYFRSGAYPAPVPFVPGEEGAGTIAAVHPSVAIFKRGDRVVYSRSLQAYATYTAVDATNALILPPDIPTRLAAASFLQGLTSISFISEAAEVKEGQWVLVHAAAGGVGLLMCQILKEKGAKVIGTASTDEKCALAKMHGAGWVVNSRDEKMVEKIWAITGGHGADVILDGIGKATFESDLEIVARKGIIVSFGNASGFVPPVDIMRLKPKNIKLMRPVMTGYVAGREDLETHAKSLFGLLESGKLNIKIYKTYQLKDVAQAHSDLEDRKTTGKLVIGID